MRNRCVGGWGAPRRLCFHKDLRLRRTRKSPNVDLVDLFLGRRRHPGTEGLTNERLGRRVCSWAGRQVCLRLLNPSRERTTQLPRGLSWSDPVALVETLGSVTSFVQRVVQPPTQPHLHTLSPPPLLVTWIWLTAAGWIRPHRCFSWEGNNLNPTYKTKQSISCGRKRNIGQNNNSANIRCTTCPMNDVDLIVFQGPYLFVCSTWSPSQCTNLQCISICLIHY